MLQGGVSCSGPVCDNPSQRGINLGSGCTAEFGAALGPAGFHRSRAQEVVPGNLVRGKKVLRRAGVGDSPRASFHQFPDDHLVHLHHGCEVWHHRMVSTLESTVLYM